MPAPPSKPASTPLATPPPARHGVRPSSVVLPAGDWPTLLDFLGQRFPSVPRAVWQTRLDAGDVTTGSGQVARAHHSATPGLRLYYYREVPDEAPIAAQETVLWQDAHLLVVDKPHGLPVLPSGKHVRHTLLARLQERLDAPALSPIHRIDKDTAGLVLFSLQAASRNAYQALFRQRLVHKTYECIAPWNPLLPWPLHRQSRIVPSPAHFMQQTEAVGDGVVNAITDIAPLEVLGPWARYRLQPLTGQRHQLRVHMHALGLPIAFDGIYPLLRPEGSNAPSRPLQLLARALAFTDPLSGEPRHFQSQHQLLGLAEVQARMAAAA